MSECQAHDYSCEEPAVFVIDIYALGESMQLRVCIEHYRALAATGVKFIDCRPGNGIYTVPDDALVVVIVGDA